MQARLSASLSAKNILSEKQFGFRNQQKKMSKIACGVFLGHSPVTYMTFRKIFFKENHPKILNYIK